MYSKKYNIKIEIIYLLELKLNVMSPNICNTLLRIKNRKKPLQCMRLKKMSANLSFIPNKKSQSFIENHLCQALPEVRC